MKNSSSLINFVKRVIMMLLIVNTSTSLYANTKSKKLSLDELKSIAVEQSPYLSVQKSAISETEAEVAVAKSAALPNVSLESRYSRYYNPTQTTVFTPNGLVAADIKKKYGLESSLTVSQVVYTFGKIKGALAAAEAATRLSANSYANAEVELELNVAKAYYGVLLAENTESILQDSLNNARSNKKIFRRRFRSGRVPQGDLLRLERDIVSRKPNVDSALQQKQKSYQSLKMLVGVPYTSDLKLSGSLTPSGSLPPKNKAIDQLMKYSPSIKMASDYVKIQKEAYGIQRASRWPDIGAFASKAMSWEDNEIDFSTNQARNSFDVIGLSISMDIYQGGAKQAEIGAAMARMRKAEFQLQDTGDKIRLQLEHKYAEYYSLKQQYESNLKFLKLAESTFNMTRKRFKVGQTSIAELNDSESLLTQAKLQIQDTMYKIQITRSEVFHLIGIKEAV